jgi:hypothetical protein
MALSRTRLAYFRCFLLLQIVVSASAHSKGLMACLAALGLHAGKTDLKPKPPTAIVMQAATAPTKSTFADFQTNYENPHLTARERQAQSHLRASYDRAIERLADSTLDPERPDGRPDLLARGNFILEALPATLSMEELTQLNLRHPQYGTALSFNNNAIEVRDGKTIVKFRPSRSGSDGSFESGIHQPALAAFTEFNGSFSCAKGGICYYELPVGLRKDPETAEFVFFRGTAATIGAIKKQVSQSMRQTYANLHGYTNNPLTFRRKLFKSESSPTRLQFLQFAYETDLFRGAELGKAMLSLEPSEKPFLIREAGDGSTEVLLRVPAEKSLSDMLAQYLPDYKKDPSYEVGFAYDTRRDNVVRVRLLPK